MVAHIHAADQPAGNYRLDFHRCLAATTAHLLDIMGQDNHGLDETIRVLALHTLSYALAVDHAWPTARDLVMALAPKMELAGQRYDWIPYLVRTCEGGQST